MLIALISFLWVQSRAVIFAAALAAAVRANAIYIN
jgi:hypothetical protein